MVHKITPAREVMIKFIRNHKELNGKKIPLTLKTTVTIPDNKKGEIIEIEKFKVIMDVMLDNKSIIVFPYRLNKYITSPLVIAENNINKIK